MCVTVRYSLSLAAFVCHHNTYLIYASLHKRSLTRFAIVTHVSVSTSYVFCVILGLAGFLTFIAETQGQLCVCGEEECTS